MEYDMKYISDFELLGQVLDGVANYEIRQAVIQKMVNPLFEEYFLLAIKATRLFDN